MYKNLQTVCPSLFFSFSFLFLFSFFSSSLIIVFSLPFRATHTYIRNVHSGLDILTCLFSFLFCFVFVFIIFCLVGWLAFAMLFLFGCFWVFFSIHTSIPFLFFSFFFFDMELYTLSFYARCNC